MLGFRVRIIFYITTVSPVSRLTFYNHLSYSLVKDFPFQEFPFLTQLRDSS